MVMCFAPDCKHYSERGTCKKFFRFPHEPKEKQRWIKLLRREDREPTPHSLVCSCHFKNENKSEGPTLFSYNLKKRSSFESPIEKKRIKRQTFNRQMGDNTDNFENNKNLNIPVKYLHQICRTCLGVDKLFNIKNVNVEGTNLLDVVSASIQFENNSELPQNMCMNCITKFYEIDSFLKECKRTQVFLQNMVLNQNMINLDKEVTLANRTEPTNQTNEYSDERSNDSIIHTNVIETQEIPIEKNKTSDKVVIDAFVLESQKTPTEKEDEVALKLPDNFESDCFQETILKFLKLDKAGIETEKLETKITDRTFMTSDLDAIVLEKQAIPMEKNKSNVAVTETIVCKARGMSRKKVKTNSSFIDTIKSSNSVVDEDRVALDLHKNGEIEHFRETVLKFLKLDETQTPEIGIKITNPAQKKFACEFCGRKFRTKCYLVQHIRVHTGEKPFSCKICKKCFGMKRNYRRHLLTHSDSKKYLCSKCGKGFIAQSQLGNHERKHHGAEKLRCTFCGKEFTDYSLFCKHRREKHLIKEIKLDPSIPFQCKTCGKIYANEKLLEDHENKHLKINRQNSSKNEFEHC